MRITISGLPGSGTTTLGKMLADRYNCEYISAGEVFRSMAAERSLCLSEFGLLCEEDPGVDKLIDERQRVIALGSDMIVAEGRLSGWMIPEADIKIWVFASVSCRVARIYERDGCADRKTAENETLAREASEAIRYRQYYNIDISAIDIYDLVLNSEKHSPEQLAKIVDAIVIQ
jgi:cytidylate kinase